VDNISNCVQRPKWIYLFERKDYTQRLAQRLAMKQCQTVGRIVTGSGEAIEATVSPLTIRPQRMIPAKIIMGQSQRHTASPVPEPVIVGRVTNSDNGRGAI